MAIRIINADVFDGLRQLEDESVNCVVTSPPYWGLRDYGVEGQIGLEPSLQDHIDVLVCVFREVRRVLRKDGTLWLNYGDAYNAHPGQRKTTDKAGPKQQTSAGALSAPSRHDAKFKPKDLLMMPARIAIALQDDGWWVRSEIVWAKQNGMPESVTDRPTSSHEKVFLLAKSERYYYDSESVREEAVAGYNGSSFTKGKTLAKQRMNAPTSMKERANTGPDAGRNMRNVWSLPTEPSPIEHYAIMPTAIAERCIKAGCPTGGVVLDPFGGVGTTGVVADRLGRESILIELSKKHAASAEKRIRGDAPLFASVSLEAGALS